MTSAISEQSARRSANMARIRAKNTGPELALRRAIWKKGLRYRLNLKIEGTRPDMVFLPQRLVVFVDGCFWHGCPLHYVRPRTRPDFWAEKLASNTTRDRLQTMQLIKNGWCVIRIWEHEIDTELPHIVDDIVLACSQQPPKFKKRPIVTCVKEVGTDSECWHIEDLLCAGENLLECRPRRSR